MRMPFRAEVHTRKIVPAGTYRRYVLPCLFYESTLWWKPDKLLYRWFGIGLAWWKWQVMVVCFIQCKENCR